MKKLLRATLILSALSLLFFTGVALPTASAKGSAAVEATILSTKVVPEAEVNRIVALGPPACEQDIGGGSTTLCEETYPGGTRVNLNISLAGREVTIFGKDGKKLSAGTAVGQTDKVRNADGEVIAERPNPNANAGSTRCAWNNMGQCFLNIPGYLVSGIGYFLLTVSSVMLGIAGAVFNWVIIRTVFQFALYFGTSPGMLVAWGVLRDIANIGLLFGFIFIGIATILNTHSVEGFTAKKALPRLIIFAVLLNFSLFATQGIIDVANGFSSVFATYAATDCSTAVSSDAGAVVEKDGARCSNLGISGKILTAAGMNHVLPSGSEAIKSLSQMAEQPYTYGTVLIVLSILVSITAVVLFAAAIMLVVRVVILSLLMVTSPIGFAGMVIPGLHGIANDWWKKLINQSFFAPIYLLMVFISLKLVEGLQSTQINISDAIMGTGGNGLSVSGNMQVLVVFAVVIGFMIAALMVAQKMGAYGADFATKSAGGLVLGAQGFVARRTVGRLSGYVGNSIRNSSIGHTEVGRFMAGVTDKGSSASFSTRNLAGGLLKGTGVDLGKANKDAGHGYHGIEEKAVKARVDYAKTLRGRDETKAENRTRVQTEQEALENERQAATDAIPLAEIGVTDAQTAITTATALRDSKQRERDSVSLHLADQKAQVAKDPTNSDAQIQLQDLQDQMVRADKELSQSEQGIVSAEQGLIGATSALAAANKAETAAYEKEVDTKKREAISTKERQIRYAKSIEHSGDPITLAGHANHLAAGKIIKDAGKSDTERMLEKLAEKAKEEKSDHGPDTSHAPKTKGGGGDSHEH